MVGEGRRQVRVLCLLGAWYLMPKLAMQRCSHDRMLFDAADGHQRRALIANADSMHCYVAGRRLPRRTGDGGTRAQQLRSRQPHGRQRKQRQRLRRSVPTIVVRRPQIL